MAEKRKVYRITDAQGTKEQVLVETSAEQVTVADSTGVFTATNVEGVLKELDDKIASAGQVADVQINGTSIVDADKNANVAVDGTYNADSNKVATQNSVSSAVTSAINALDGSATIASKSGDIVTIKAGIAETNGIISNSGGSDVVLGSAAVKTALTGDSIPSDSANLPNATQVRAFVNSSIEASAARYMTYNASGDAFPTKASLDSASTFYYNGTATTPTKNDYLVVLADETKGQTVEGYTAFTTTNQYVGYFVYYASASPVPKKVEVTSSNKDSLGITAGTTPAFVNGSDPTTRYLYTGSIWSFQYIVNNASFTAAQWASINSGATSSKISQIDTNTAAIATKIDTAGTGLSKNGTTLNHSNSVTAKTTQAIYPITFDAQGHITGAGNAFSETQLSKGATSGSGNVVTDISVNNHQITLTKGVTALTENQTITLSGDVTGSGKTAITATIGDNKVTTAKLATPTTTGDTNVYTAFTKNNKGQIISAGTSIEWGTSGQTTPSENLMVGGLFFELQA